MNRVLLDTSVVVSEGTVDDSRESGISMVTLGELRAGVRLARNERVRGARRRRLERITQLFILLPVDEPVALAYGDVLATARSAGRVTKATDLLIIATALAHGLALVTLDDRQRALADLAGVRAA